MFFFGCLKISEEQKFPQGCYAFSHIKLRRGNIE